MKTLMLLEWREIARDLRSWLIALLPALLFSAGRTVDFSNGGAVLPAGNELLDFGCAALVLEMGLLVDLFAYQRDRGELELLRLLPLRAERLLCAKLLVALLPVAALGALQCLWAWLLLRREADFSAGAVLPALLSLLALYAFCAAFGAFLSLTGRTLRAAAAKLLLLVLGSVGLLQTLAILRPDRPWLPALLFFALAALSFALLANRWKSPEKWLVR